MNTKADFVRNLNKYILDENGEPKICNDVYVWGEWYENVSNRSILFNQVGDVKVSTVFLGLDHSFGIGDPVLWGSLITGGSYDGHEERYRSKKEAITNHDKLVEMVKESFGA
jgi:hypothetical protein